MTTSHKTTHTHKFIALLFVQVTSYKHINVPLITGYTWCYGCGLREYIPCGKKYVFYALGNDIWDLVTQLNHPIQLVAMIINHKKNFLEYSRKRGASNQKKLFVTF